MTMDMNMVQDPNSPSTKSPEPGSKAPSGLTSIALKGLLLITSFYTLYFARAVILPLVLAFLLTFLLRPVVRDLKRLRIPEWAGAALVLLVLLSITSYGVLKLSRPAAVWMEKVPESLSKIEVKVSFLHKSLETLNRVAEELKTISRMGEEKRPEVEIKRPAFADTILTGSQEFFAKASVMLILLYFLLASGDLFLNKTIKVFPGLDRKKEIVKIVRTVEQQISKYLFTVTVINAFMGFFLGLGMYLIGMPNPVLWGVMGGFLVFLPYLGPLFGIAIVTLVAFFTFDSLGRILLAPALYFALEIIQGQIITPMVLGFRLALNPVAIFVWLIFWGWMWGIVGALLAVPMLTVFKILCDHIPPIAPVGEFLGR
jgi:predicted PurR-regulated permease PerM